MNRTIPWHCIALAGAAALTIGCSPNQPSSGSVPGAQTPPAATSREDQVPRAPGASTPGRSAAAEVMARADVQPVGGSSVRGTAEFRGDESGPLSIDLTLTGLEAGSHGIEVLQGSDCAATHAGGQSAPSSSVPGAPGATPEQQLSLGDVIADASGKVHETLRAAGAGAEAGFVGKVIVVHGGGDAAAAAASSDGQPVACGVIEAANGTKLSQGDSSQRGV